MMTKFIISGIEKPTGGRKLCRSKNGALAWKNSESLYSKKGAYLPSLLHAPISKGVTMEQPLHLRTAAEDEVEKS